MPPTAEAGGPGLTRVVRFHEGVEATGSAPPRLSKTTSQIEQVSRWMASRLSWPTAIPSATAEIDTWERLGGDIEKLKHMHGGAQLEPHAHEFLADETIAADGHRMVHIEKLMSERL